MFTHARACHVSSSRRVCEQKFLVSQRKRRLTLIAQGSDARQAESAAASQLTEDAADDADATPEQPPSDTTSTTPSSKSGNSSTKPDNRTTKSDAKSIKSDTKPTKSDNKADSKSNKADDGSKTSTPTEKSADPFSGAASEAKLASHIRALIAARRSAKALRNRLSSRRGAPRQLTATLAQGKSSRDLNLVAQVSRAEELPVASLPTVAEVPTETELYEELTSEERLGTRLQVQVSDGVKQLQQLEADRGLYDKAVVAVAKHQQLVAGIQKRKLEIGSLKLQIQQARKRRPPIVTGSVDGSPSKLRSVETGGDSRAKLLDKLEAEVGALSRRLAVASVMRDMSEVRWAEAYLRHQLWDLPEQASISMEYFLRGVLRVLGQDSVDTVELVQARQLFTSRAVDAKMRFRRRRSSVIIAKAMTDVALHDSAVTCATGIVWALLELRGLLTEAQLSHVSRDQRMLGKAAPFGKSELDGETDSGSDGEWSTDNDTSGDEDESGEGGAGPRAEPASDDAATTENDDAKETQAGEEVQHKTEEEGDDDDDGTISTGGLTILMDKPKLSRAEAVAKARAAGRAAAHTANRSKQTSPRAGRTQRSSQSRRRRTASTSKGKRKRKKRRKKKKGPAKLAALTQAAVRCVVLLRLATRAFNMPLLLSVWCMAGALW